MALTPEELKRALTEPPSLEEEPHQWTCDEIIAMELEKFRQHNPEGFRAFLERRQ